MFVEHTSFRTGSKGENQNKTKTKQKKKKEAEENGKAVERGKETSKQMMQL